MEADAEEHPIEEDENDAGEQSERKLLKRKVRAQALARLEDAARTAKDFENVIAWWDKLDVNRERRERYHELSRSGDDVPLDYGAAKDALYFPDGKDYYAWKGYDFDVINGLDEEDYIRQGSHPSRSKSVYLTDSGIDYAKKLMEKYGIEDWS